MESLYNEITKYTYYPTPTQYRDVIDRLLYRYPYFRESKDIYVDEDNIARKWKNILSDKFRNMRKRRDSDVAQVISQKRKMQNGAKPETTLKKTSIQSKMWGVKYFMPERPHTEDTATIELAIQWMVNESSKRKQDIHGINQRMNLTFADRRKMIVEGATPVNKLKEVFPMMFEEDGILAEFKRISGFDIDERLLASLQKYAEKLILLSPQANEIMKEINQKSVDQRNRFAAYQALLLLPALLKEDVCKIVCPSELKPDKVTTPVIFYDEETVEKSTEFLVVADDTQISKLSEFIMALEVLFCTYYVFNISYAKKSSNTLTFMQHFLLTINDGTCLPRKVLSLVSKLKE